MAHCIHGIITSFPYTGPKPHVILVGPYHFIPVQQRSERSFREELCAPYDHLTPAALKLIRELSFKGKCAYVETDFFGGPGSQKAEVWQDGKRILGPIASWWQMKSRILQDTHGNPVEIVEDAINFALRAIGIFCTEGRDEFDSAGLGRYRKNDEVIREFEYRKRNS